jgi:hypothetical protein
VPELIENGKKARWWNRINKKAITIIAILTILGILGGYAKKGLAITNEVIDRKIISTVEAQLTLKIGSFEAEIQEVKEGLEDMTAAYEANTLAQTRTHELLKVLIAK